MSILAHGAPCKIDQDCPSNVCEMTYDNLGNPEGRKCLEKNQKYGKLCLKNTDCASGICEEIFNSNGQLEEPPLGPRRCKAIDFEPVEKKWPYNMPGSEAEYSINKDLVNSTLAKQKLGSVGEFIIQITNKILDMVALLMKTVVGIFYSIFKGIFNMFLGNRNGSGPLGGGRGDAPAFGGFGGNGSEMGAGSIAGFNAASWGARRRLGGTAAIHTDGIH